MKGKLDMQEVLWFLFSKLGDYRTLPVPAQNYFKYYFCQIVTLDYLFQEQENLKNLA